MNELKAELRRLYADSSKHSTYQNIPDFVSAEIGYKESVNEKWRGDRPRLHYLYQHQHPTDGETWLDFGANTGFFTLSMAREFPRASFIAVEANPNHARFIQRIAEYFELRNVEVINRSIGYRELPTLPRSSFMLHLNVLHHAGHDFDADLVPVRGRFNEYCRRYLSSLREGTRAMLFQMGSNWGGLRSEPLVGVRKDGDKLRMLVSLLQESGWVLRHICYPKKHSDDHIAYFDLSFGEVSALQTLGFLDEFPGEFHRRPMFICERASE